MAFPQPRKYDQSRLWDYALGALGRRALSASELRARLERRAEDPSCIPALLDKLAEYGYLDDRRFAESFAAARKENQHLGRQRVLRDLRQRRVHPEQAEAAVGKAFEGSDEVALIEEHLRRKFRGVNLAEELQDPARLNSAYRKLRYAGFSGSNSIRVLRRYSERAASLEDDPIEE